MKLDKQYWDSLEKSCPKEVKAWHDWLKIYCEKNNLAEILNVGCPNYPSVEIHAPSIHDLPDAMQFGVYIQYGFETEGPVYIGEFEEIHESIRKTFHEREQNNNT